MEILAKINELAAKYSDYTANNLSKLVKIKSTSMHEKDVQLELKRQMEEAGFDEVRIDGLGNVIGRIGNGKRILAIDGHMDTVDIGNIDSSQTPCPHFCSRDINSIGYASCGDGRRGGNQYPVSRERSGSLSKSRQKQIDA